MASTNSRNHTDDSSINEHNSNRIVHFNVGGTKYDVAKSTIELYPNTMLARLISDKWQESPNQEIFIDRDGPRFRCVLDYMRDKKVDVPVGASSKGSVIHELFYFGFDVPEDSIMVSWEHYGAAVHMKMCEEKHKVDLEMLLQIHNFSGSSLNIKTCEKKDQVDPKLK